MRTYLKLFCLALPIMIAFDLAWVGVIAAGFYRDSYGPLLSAHPNFLAVVIFYVLYILGLIYFAIRPALFERSLAKAVLRAGALGFVAYMTYDLTNLAIITNWPLLVSVVDVAWGTILSGIVSGLTYVIATKVFRM